MNDKLTMIELFSGIGAQERAIRQLKLPYEVVNTCDLDKDAVLSYATMRYDIEKEMETFDFPSQSKMIEELQSKNLGYDFKNNKHTITHKTSIKKLKQYYISDQLVRNLGDISKVEKLPYADLVTYSFPCFAPGTMVLTDKGFKNIEDIAEGDMVLTHTNQYQKVIKPMKNYCDSIVYRINTMCSDPIYTTEEHPFYVRKRYFKYSSDVRYTEGANKGKEKRQRLFGLPEWIKAKDLTKDYYVGTAINQKSIIPQWNGMTFTWSTGATRFSNKIGKYMDNSDFWWIIGRYIGDGWLVNGYGKRPSTGIKICCAKNETSEITSVLDRMELNYVITKERTVNKIQLSSRELYEFCTQFGRGAANKRLTNTIFDLPINLLKSFLDGYMSADGYFTNNVYKATSVSKELIYGLGQCVAKVYHVPFSIYKTVRPKTCVIEGRTVNQKDSYNITWRLTSAYQTQGFYEDGYVWQPIRTVETELYDGFVYNMEVENDNSYVVQNIIVHNCTDLSVAGKGEGMVNKCECGHSWLIDFTNSDNALICPKCGAVVSSSTRSGLLGQVQRLLAISKENNELPKYLLLENVKNLVGKQFKPQFDAWLKWLDSIGYNTYYKVLNAKKYGIPQNRERVFAISIRKDIDTGYTFPEEIQLTTRLKDILETNVDERYYLSDDRVEQVINTPSFKNHLKNNIDTIKVKNQGTEFDGCTDVAGTLMARDYKGFGNQSMTAVLEPQIIQKFGDRGTDQYSIRDCAHTIPANPMSDRGQMVAEPFCVASRGRNPENPSDRTAGSPTEQRLEPNFSGCTNTLTSVAKDNYVCEPQLVGGIGEKNFGKQYRQGNRVYDSDAIAMALTAQPLGNAGGYSYLYAVEEPVIIEDFYKNRDIRIYENESPTLRSERVGLKVGEPDIRWRIRKLTPKECFRLMNFTDSDCDRSAQYVSVSAQYKQCGNSIVVSVLIALMSALLINDGYKSDVWTKYQLHYSDDTQLI